MSHRAVGREGWEGATGAYVVSQRYLIPYCINAYQVPFIGRLIDPFQYAGLLGVHIHVKHTDVISPRSKLHVAMLFVKREIFDVDFTNALEHGWCHPRVIPIVGHRNFGFVFLQRAGGVHIFVGAGK